ncbi:MAG: TonB-dependent siderophore receptor [Betaproteobacteria bacterium]|nr:MAG: TonB-dependent siderophore receptor [Betaproteobacteria bacterium]
MTQLARVSVPSRLPLALAISAVFAVPSFAQPAAKEGAAVTLPPVELIGRTASGAYYSEDATGAKTELDLRELPQSVRVITRQAIADLGATKLDDVLDYVGGVSRQNVFGGLWDNIAIRGLPGNENTGMATLLNGFSSNRGFNAPRDLAGVERIEFLKGTAAALYGSSEPGGTLNIVSKRPLWQTANSIEAYIGSYNLKRGAFDSTGPLGPSVAYRLNVAVEDRDSFRDEVRIKRTLVAPALSWKIAPATTLDYSGEFLQQFAPLDRGVVAVNNQLGVIAQSRFLGEPADGNVKVENHTHQAILSHELNQSWKARVGLSYRETFIYGFSTEPTALQANGNLTRQRRFRDYNSDDVALQAELQGKLRTGFIEHELLLGFESFQFNMDTLMLRVNPSAASPYAINIYNPVYGQKQPTPGPNTSTLEKQRNTAFYVQNAMKLGSDWRLVAGLRADNYRQSLENRRTNVTARQDPSSVAPRLGLSWLPTAQWSLYANAGRSFRPNVGADVTARGFDPETGVAVELGAKWESANKRIGATAALFDIRKKNVLTSDPKNAGFSIAAGEIRSRGAELDFAGQVTKNWRVNSSLTLNDVEIIRDNTLEVGGRLLNVPKVNASMLAVYEGVFANGQRFGIGGGVTHTGKRLGQARTGAEATAGTAAFELPAYTTAKLDAHWRVNPTLHLTLDVDNVFDKDYYTASFSRLWVTPGTSRTITLGLQAKF